MLTTASNGPAAPLYLVMVGSNTSSYVCSKFRKLFCMGVGKILSGSTETVAECIVGGLWEEVEELLGLGRKTAVVMWGL